MWLLGRLLPLMIGDLVPEGDGKWENFLLIMKIVDRLFSPKLSSDDVGALLLNIIASFTNCTHHPQNAFYDTYATPHPLVSFIANYDYT